MKMVLDFKGPTFNPSLNATIFPPKKWPDYEAHHEIWRIFEGILGKKLKIRGLKNGEKITQLERNVLFQATIFRFQPLIFHGEVSLHR